MRIYSIILVCFLSWSVLLQAEESLTLSWSEWSVPKSAETVLAMPVLRSVMQQLQVTTSSQLAIYYPGGDEGSLWAIELRGWLVSLGLESDRIKLVSGSQYPDRLQLQIEE